MKKITTIILIMAASLVMAQRGGIENEDLQFIRDWQRDQVAQAVAQAAALTPDQVATLTAVKAEVDAIQADADAQRTAFEDNLAVLAASIRANIEATGVFSDEDHAALCEARSEARLGGKEIKMRIGLATLPLENLLTDAQKEAIAATVQANRYEGCQGDGPGPGEAALGNGAGRGQGQGQGLGQGPGRGGENGRQGKGKGKMLRILLSDAFLNYYQ